MNLLYILLALVVLLVMITVHEFGHYIAGKIFGFKINEFSIGFGPAIFKRTRKDGEIFAIRALPLGGFCAFEGEDEDGKDNPEAFNRKPAWKRLIVLLSGVTFNFLFGILTAAIYLFVTGYATPKISSSVNSAEITGSGLRQNDIIIAVDGKTIENYRSFDSLIAKFEDGETFIITVERDGKIVDVESSKQKYPNHYVVYNLAGLENRVFDENGKAVDYNLLCDAISKFQIPENSENAETKGSGAGLLTFFENYYTDKDKTKKFDLEAVKDLVEDQTIVYLESASVATMGITYVYNYENYTIFEAAGKAWPFSFYLCDTILDALGGLFTGTTELKDMGGTVTAVSQIAEISQMGIEFFLLLLPLLAMNLALFNILPIPSLDGARAVFVLIEMIFKKPVPRKIEGWIHTVGLFLLLGLVVFFDIYHFAVAAKLLMWYGKIYY